MTSDFIINLISPQGLSSTIQFLVVVLEFVYLVFAFIVIFQVNLMNKTFTTSAAFFFSLLAFIHFFAALGLFILSLLIL